MADQGDRNSTYSSFYRGRKDSFDVLGGSGPAPNAGGRTTPIADVFSNKTGSTQDRDDRSSFFQPNRLSRGSGDMLFSQAQSQGQQQQQHHQQQQQNSRPSAGYNRDSFFDPGRSMPVRGGADEYPDEEMGFLNTQERQAAHHQEEEEVQGGWDVFNDFNNKGPKYSDAYGTGGGLSTVTSKGYHELQTPNPSFSKSARLSQAPSPQKLSPNGSQTSLPAHAQTELVTVPILGPDWKKTEIEGMRKATRREARNDARRETAKRWWRDQYGCCGGLATRKTLVIILFVLCVLVATILGITIPRVPGFSFDADKPLTNNTASQAPSEFSRAPANFSFPALLNIQIDTHSNNIPLKIKGIHCDIYCLDTNVPIGGGDLAGTTIPAKRFQPESIPVTFNYTAVNDSDTTWLQFYNACRNPSQFTNGERPGFNLKIILTTSIAGLIHKVTSSTQITKVGCPFQLPNNSV